MAGPSPSVSDDPIPPAPDPSAPGFFRSRPVLIGLATGALVLAVGLAVVAIRSIPDNPASLRQVAARAQQSGDWKGLKQALDRLGEAVPLSSQGLLARSSAESELGLADEAVRDLEKVPDSDPLAGIARLRQGQIELRRDHLAAAEDALLKAVEIAPDLLQAHRELIYIYGVQLRRDELDREFRACARLQTLDYSQCYLWCASRTLEWDPDEQVKTLRSYLKADPSDRWSRLALADNLVRLSKLDEASAALDPLPKDDPRAIALRVQIALARNDRDRARALLESAPEDDPQINQIRGQLALSRRDAETAVSMFEAANRSNPHDRAILSGLASALALQGQTERAKEVREQASKLDQLSSLLSKAGPHKPPNDPSYPLKAGRVCEQAGLPAQAEAWYRLAVANDPLDSDAKQALYDLLHSPAAGEEPPSNP